MIMQKLSRRIVSSRPGEGTADTIYEDEDGRLYRPISRAEADMIRNSTAGVVYTIHSNGTVS